MIDNYYAVVMAGGGGTRFWPRSRRALPKQFLSLTGEKTLLQETVARVLRDCPPERVLVVTAAQLTGVAQAQLPDIPPANILAEPQGRGTAACIGLAAIVAQTRCQGDPVIGVFAADHDIHPAEAFSHTIRKAAAVAVREDSIVLVGIMPTFPATGFGYIRRGAALGNEFPGVFRVDEFIEKPSFRKAENFIASGHYLWNACIFFFRAGVALGELHRRQPALSERLESVRAALGTPRENEALTTAYEDMPSISFDHAVMEGVSKAYVVESSFLWDDVGSWLALERHLPKNEAGNVVRGDAILVDSRHCTVDSKRLVALVGVEDLIVVETPDAILICDRHRAEDVRQVVARLEHLGRTELL